MILVADSGSTKTDWRAIDVDGTEKKYTTAGINPFHQRGDDITSIIKTNDVSDLAGKISAGEFEIAMEYDVAEASNHCTNPQ